MQFPAKAFAASPFDYNSTRETPGLINKQLSDNASVLAIRSESYDLIEAKGDKSFAVVMVWVAAVLPFLIRILLVSSLNATAVLAWFLLITLHLSATMMMRGRRLRRSHIKATHRGISLFDGDSCLWTVVWSDIDRVSLRAYRMPMRSFGEAYVITLKDGQERIIPSRSHVFGQMPNGNAFEDRLRSLGIFIEYDRNIRWLGFLSF